MVVAGVLLLSIAVGGILAARMSSAAFGGGEFASSLTKCDAGSSLNEGAPTPKDHFRKHCSLCAICAHGFAHDRTLPGSYLILLAGALFALKRAWTVFDFLTPTAAMRLRASPARAPPCLA